MLICMPNSKFGKFDSLILEKENVLGGFIRIVEESQFELCGCRCVENETPNIVLKLFVPKFTFRLNLVFSFITFHFSSVHQVIFELANFTIWLIFAQGDVNPVFVRLSCLHTKLNWDEYVYRTPIPKHTKAHQVQGTIYPR